MSDSRLEELAALHALGLLDEAGQKELWQIVGDDARGEQTLRDFAETAASLVHDAPAVQPPPTLKREILHQLPGRSATSRVSPFTPWLPYAIAACLMALGIYQTRSILALNQELTASRSEAVVLKQSNALMGLRLTTLEAKDAAYGSARIMVAWDPHLHRGVISLQNLPLPPAGHDYQLWVLDPNAQVPISAGLLTANASSRGFAVQPVSVTGPGFAISLEPSGGQPTPTGPILFAVEPQE